MQAFVRKSMLVIVDILLINLAYFIAYELRFEFFVPEFHTQILLRTFLLVTFVHLLFYILLGMYNSLWRYMSIDELFKLIIAATLSSIAIYIINISLRFGIPRSVILINWMFIIFSTGALRLMYRVLRRAIQTTRMKPKGVKNVMIVGAGDAGSMIIRELMNYRSGQYKPVIVVDDAKWKENTSLMGVTVRSDISLIPEYVNQFSIDEIIIAIPSLSKKRLADIVSIAQRTSCKVKTLPGIYDIVDNKVSMKNIRDVDIEDLLGREETKIDLKEIAGYIENRVILVTGAGGSIGSELCKQIIKFNPSLLLLLDIYENNVYSLQQELMFQNPNISSEIIIASIRDKHRLDQVFGTYKPEIVFHAAAHKHVPLMESNPEEAIKNNVQGTQNVVMCAHENKVKRFVLISSDKAVNPTNIMGATKRIAELIIQSVDQISETEFVAVRFGNVLGSNGSVIPLFKNQIANGGPLTITHPEMTRYFMTIPEAARLVLQAGSIAKGGEIFVLDMGEPVKIVDLAYQLIKLSGYVPDYDIAIKYTGLRPGEKLYEELLLKEEGIKLSTSEGIFIAKPSNISYSSLQNQLLELYNCLDSKVEIMNALRMIVPTYIPDIGMNK